MIRFTHQSHSVNNSVDCETFIDLQLVRQTESEENERIIKFYAVLIDRGVDNYL